MKKTYSKPSVIIENFTLSTNIAGDCERPFNLQAQFICAIPDESGSGMTLFSGSVDSMCDAEGDGDKAIYDGFCYHVPTENRELFNS